MIIKKKKKNSELFVFNEVMQERTRTWNEEMTKSKYNEDIMRIKLYFDITNTNEGKILRIIYLI